MAAAQDYLSGLQYGAPGGGVGVNADKMNPEFAARMAALIQAAEQATGDKVTIFEGYRDPARSAQLRANYKGVPVSYGGKTYQPQAGVKGYKAAGPGKSEHNYGMAADIRAGKNPDKYPSGPAYDYMVKHAKEFGLENLGASDPAHFQIPRSEYKQALAGKPLQQPFKNYNPAGLTPPMNIPQVATALDVIDRVVPRPMPSQIASAYASTQTPPRLPASPAVPRLQADNTLSYGQKSGITPEAKYAAAQSSHNDFGLGALADPRTSALLAPARMPPSIAAAGQATAMPQSVGIHGAASLSAPVAAAPPVPMPGRPAALAATTAPVHQTFTVQPLPSSYAINPNAVIDKAKQAGVISGPASWLPDQTIWDGAMGQQGMRDRIAAGLPQGSSLDPKTNTVHVADPQALANEYLGKVPSLFRPMAREAIIPAIHYAESAGYVKPQWPASQTFPLPVPRPATPTAPVRAPTVQDTLNEQAQMRRAAVPALPAAAAGVSPPWWSQAFPTPAPIYPPVNLNRPVGVLPSYVMPRSLPTNFYAQPAQTRVATSVAAPRIVAPVPMPAPSPSNGGGYANGKQNAINDTLRTLGFNV